MFKAKNTIESVESNSAKPPALPSVAAARANVFDKTTLVQIGAGVSPNPRVSVIVPAYQVADFIGETLVSVFAQTFTDYEVLLINDGSPDTIELERAVEPFFDRIIYIKQTNGGVANARNAGIARARGELIAFLDGDDVWLPEFLTSQIEFLENNCLDMVYADALLFGDIKPTDKTYMQHTKSNGAVTTESLLGWTCNVITSGTLVNRQQIVAAGMFDESAMWQRGEDFEMWFRLAKNNAKIGYQRKVLLKYRVRIGSLTGDHLDQAAGSVTVLNNIKNKFALTPTETVVWHKQITLAHSVLAVEKGKAALKNADFRGARKHFRRAAPLYSRPKIWVLSLGLLLAPHLVRRTIKNYNFER